MGGGSKLLSGFSGTADAFGKAGGGRSCSARPEGVELDVFNRVSLRSMLRGAAFAAGGGGGGKLTRAMARESSKLGTSQAQRVNRNKRTARNSQLRLFGSQPLLFGTVRMTIAGNSWMLRS